MICVRKRLSLCCFEIEGIQEEGKQNHTEACIPVPTREMGMKFPSVRRCTSEVLEVMSTSVETGSAGASIIVIR